MKATTKVLIAVIVALGLWAGWLNYSITRLKERVYDTGIALLNAEAEADSQINVLLDSLKVASRLMAQKDLAVDSLARSLGIAEMQAEAILSASVDTVEGSGQGSVGEGATSAHFDIYSEPFSATIDVDLALSPPAIDYRFALDPAPIRVRVGCGEGEIFPPPSFRRARVEVTGPQWLSIQLINPTVSPDVCNPKTEFLKGTSVRNLYSGIVSGLIAGTSVALLTYDGEGELGSDLIVGALIGAGAGILWELVIN